MKKSAVYVCYMFSSSLPTRFFVDANNMNPDQTAPKEQSDLGPYCLQYRLPKNINRQEEQMTKFVTGGLWVNRQCKDLVNQFRLHNPGGRHWLLI